MERADAGKSVALHARHADVPELGVVHAEDRSAAHDAADTDPGADRDIREILEALGRTPAAFGQCRAIHVGVDADRNAELPTEPRRDVGVAPVELAGRRDVT